jgi:hypothetical protein
MLTAEPVIVNGNLLAESVNGVLKRMLSGKKEYRSFRVFNLLQKKAYSRVQA